MSNFTPLPLRARRRWTAKRLSNDSPSQLGAVPAPPQTGGRAPRTVAWATGSVSGSLRLGSRSGSVCPGPVFAPARSICAERIPNQRAPTLIAGACLDKLLEDHISQTRRADCAQRHYCGVSTITQDEASTLGGGRLGGQAGDPLLPRAVHELRRVPMSDRGSTCGIWAPLDRAGSEPKTGPLGLPGAPGHRRGRRVADRGQAVAPRSCGRVSR